MGYLYFNTLNCTWVCLRRFRGISSHIRHWPTLYSQTKNGNAHFSPLLYCSFRTQSFTSPLQNKNNSDIVKKKVDLNEHASSSASSPTPTDREDPEKNLSLLQKFKLMYKQYWYVLIPVHLLTSAVWYGSFFFAVKNGIDVVHIMEQLGVTEKFLAYIRNSNAGYYGIAYAMYKIATPARYTVTLGGTTIAINYLKNREYIKPVPTKEELHGMYVDKKEEFIERTTEMRGRYKEKRERLRRLRKRRLRKLHGMYVDKKEEFIERTEEMRGKYQEKRDRLRRKREKMRESYQEKRDKFFKRFNIRRRKSNHKKR